MEIKQLKKILDEFGDNVKFEYDLKKKKVGLILVENQKFIIKLITLLN